MKRILLGLCLVVLLSLNGCKAKESPKEEPSPTKVQISLINSAGGGVTFENSLDPDKQNECGPLTRALKFECPGYKVTVTIDITLSDPNETNTCSGSDGNFLICVPAK